VNRLIKLKAKRILSTHKNTYLKEEVLNLLRQVKIENGIVRGLPAADPRITSFKGIPFAAPPVNENRWLAPQPANDWKDVLKAYEFAPISLQVRQEIDENNIYTREWAVEPDIEMSEDCLAIRSPSNSISAV